MVSLVSKRTERGRKRMWGAAHGQAVNEPSPVSPRPNSDSVVALLGRGRIASPSVRRRSCLSGHLLYRVCFANTYNEISLLHLPLDYYNVYAIARWKEKSSIHDFITSRNVKTQNWKTEKKQRLH